MSLVFQYRKIGCRRWDIRHIPIPLPYRTWRRPAGVNALAQTARLAVDLKHYNQHYNWLSYTVYEFWGSGGVGSPIGGRMWVSKSKQPRAPLPWLFTRRATTWSRQPSIAPVRIVPQARNPTNITMYYGASIFSLVPKGLIHIPISVRDLSVLPAEKWVCLPSIARQDSPFCSPHAVSIGVARSVPR